MALLKHPDLKNKKAILVVVTLPVLLIFLLFIYFQKPVLNLLSPDFTYLVSSDKETGLGKSVYDSKRLDNGVKLDYTLKSGDPYPFVSLVFRAKDLEPFDSEGYTLNLGLESDLDNELSLRLGFLLDGHTDKASFDSYIFVEKSIPVVKGKNQFKLRLDDITRTPSWWYSYKKFSELNPPAFSRNETGYIALYDVQYQILNQKRSFTVTQFEMKPTYYGFYKYSTFGLILYCIIIYLGYKLRTRKSTKVLVPIDLSLNLPEEKNTSELIVSYLAQNFTNPDLKLEDIAKDVGLTESHISAAIKSYSGKSFKSYLNFLRIEKAKKLLLESDLQVAEIAYEVGYNSAHHFIRVFKELENCSPTVYRNEYCQS
ncbi:MAG TPA: AraC family transcriptional regulator [Cytophagaceae bacterium]